MFYKSVAISCLLVGSIFTVTAQTPAPEARSSRAMSRSINSEGSYLGVQTVEISNENFSKYGMSGVRGVAVEKVVEGSPAEKAGFLTGDVIVRVNGEDITGTRKLTRLISEIAPDHIAKIAIFRGGSERELSVTIGKRPMPKFDGATDFGTFAPSGPLLKGLPRSPQSPGESRVFAFGNPRRIGIGTTTLTKQLAEHFGVESGVIISSVRENSPAAKAGLKAGDIIVEANGKAIKSDGDLISIIAEKKEGDVSLTVVSNRDRRTVNVKPEEVKGEFDRFIEFPKALNSRDEPQVFSAPRSVIRIAPFTNIFPRCIL